MIHPYFYMSNQPIVLENIQKTEISIEQDLEDAEIMDSLVHGIYTSLSLPKKGLDKEIMLLLRLKLEKGVSTGLLKRYCQDLKPLVDAICSF